MIEENQGLSGRSPSGPGSQASPGAAEASPPSVSIPNAGMPWWAGDNDEILKVGPCATRDEALGEALAYFGEESAIHLLQADMAHWSPPSAAMVIDMMIDNSDELFPEDGFDDMAGTKEAVACAEAELDKLLSDWLDKYRSIFPTPTAFGRTGHHEVVPASGIVAATAGETEGLNERSEQSPVGEAETPETQP